MALPNIKESLPIVLGSGELWLCKYSDISDPFTITDEELEKFVNVGAIESDAQLVISQESTVIESANRGKVLRFKSSDEVRFNCGVLTFDMSEVARFLTGSKFEGDLQEQPDPEDPTKTIDINKYIYNTNDGSPAVYLRFVYKKDDGKRIFVNILKCQYDGELTFLFSKENPNLTNHEFVALTDSNGNYFELIEEI